MGVEYQLGDTFKALSDPTRREILNLLKQGPLPAGEIAEHFSMTGATVSHHLSVLKSAGLVYDRREGKFIYYFLNLSVFEEALNWLQSFLSSGKSGKNGKEETGGSK
jgi:DNA-binding transcriptional ArsR family regulator